MRKPITPADNSKELKVFYNESSNTEKTESWFSCISVVDKTIAHVYKQSQQRGDAEKIFTVTQLALNFPFKTVA